MIRVTFRPGLTNSGPVVYNAASFVVEDDESITLVDADDKTVGQIHSGVWEDVLALTEDK